MYRHIANPVVLLGYATDSASNERAGCDTAPKKLREHLKALPHYDVGSELCLLDLGDMVGDDMYGWVAEVFHQLP